jgi:hypothetical protein
MAWQNASNLDFAGYHAVWNFSYLTGLPNWWDVQAVKAVKLLWNFSDVYVYASAECTHNFGSYQHNDWLYGGSALNVSVFSADWWSIGTAGEVRTHVNFQQGDSFELFVNKVDATHVKVEIYVLRNLITVLLFSNVHVVDAGYWASVDVSLTIWHEGQGLFLGHLSDAIYTTSYDGSSLSWAAHGDDNPFTNFIGNIASAVGKVLPSWLNDILASFSGYFVWAVPIAGMLVSALATILPFLPLILFFYALDVGLTAVATGSFAPVGVMVTSLFNLASGLVHTVVAIAETVYDFIHFW